MCQRKSSWKRRRRQKIIWGHEVTEAVITVPAISTIHSVRQQRAGRIAGLEVKRIINEPTGSSLAFGMDKKREIAKLQSTVLAAVPSIFLLSNRGSRRWASVWSIVHQWWYFPGRLKIRPTRHELPYRWIQIIPQALFYAKIHWPCSVWKKQRKKLKLSSLLRSKQKWICLHHSRC